MRKSRLILLLLALVSVIEIGPSSGADKPARNVILMLSDGAGFNTWIATSMYEGKWDPAARRSAEVYDGPGWVEYGSTTYPLNLAPWPMGTGAQSERLVYRPEKAWDASQVLGKAGPLAGYFWLRTTPTDSAAAGTALITGIKTYNHAINWSDLNEPLAGRTFAEIAKARGKAVGVVTTVQWSHATPACFGGAHNYNRDAYAEIANEMLSAPWLDLIVGAGNPDFNNNGRPYVAGAKADDDEEAPAGGKRPDRNRYVGGRAVWQSLTSGTHPAGWRLIQTKAEFEALARGVARPVGKVLGTAQVYTTLQQARGKYRAGDAPFSQPLNTNVPSLATIVQGSLNVLSKAPNGFYLGIEGGAVDWANHSNQPARMIEEQIDFLRAIEAVAAWVEKNSSWDETLLVVTADHDCGLAWGPNSDKVPFEPLVDHGKGQLPGIKYNWKSHSNGLVPVYAKGAGSARLAACVRGTDKTAAEKWGFSGRYVDNTDVFKVMDAAIASPAR